MVRCNTCLATYDTTTRDGYAYYHACAPLSQTELRALITAGRSPLSPAQQRQFDDAAAFDARTPPAAGAPSQADLVLARVIIERPEKRDENIVGRGRADDPPRIKAEGKGVTTIAAAPTP